MKKIVLYLICLFLLISFVSAGDLCKESDDGKDYEEAGYVKYGVTKYNDLCVLEPDADMRVEEGIYLKEYYCDEDNDERKHKIVDCTQLGFEKCEDGRCVNSQSSQGSSQSQNSAPVYVAECGNKIVDSGEDCDPPDKICYKGSDIGLCSDTCKCEIKISSGTSSDNEEETEESESEVDSETDSKDKEDDSVEDKVESNEKDETEEVSKDSVDPDGVASTQIDRLSLPKEPKKGLFGRIWAWFADWFN